MHASIITSALFASAAFAQQYSTGELGDAEVVTNNPTGVIYRAILPEKAFSYPGPQGNIKGEIAATANLNGTGVAFSINLTNLPKTGGPLMYHIHVAPVGEDGNCTKTLAHLDPYIRGEATLCDASKPETCQVGDLSGKHGNLTSDPFLQTYNDKYASIVEGLGSNFGNRSVVIHFANKTRITCANFVAYPISGNDNTTKPTGSSTATGKPGPTTVPFIPGNGAVGNAVSIISVLSFAGLVTYLI